jgi:hypothetical protein
VVMGRLGRGERAVISDCKVRAGHATRAWLFCEPGRCHLVGLRTVLTASVSFSDREHLLAA